MVGFARGNKAMPGPGKKTVVFVTARSAATKQSRKGQPEMRQAEKLGLLRI
jgi:hypothetical protein